MNPQERFCHNKDCRAYGRRGEGHIVIHSKKERRYRVHKPKELVFTVVTLLAYGCPMQAIVAAFGLDERTVGRWAREAGTQCVSWCTSTGRGWAC